MLKDSIRELHTNKQGKVSGKWDSYLDYYDESLAHFRSREISMPEIGVQNGGSLETWSQYFAAGKHFIGCDVDPNCSKLQYDDPRINIVIGDVNSQDSYRQISSISQNFDLIIDDGSHQSIDILNAFINYFPLLKPGCTYIIEDTCCLYMKNFGGGILNEKSAQYFFKKLTAVVSFQWWDSEITMNAFLQTFFPLGNPPGFISDGWIDSIEFRNSIITVKKSKTSGHNKLGQRVVSGKELIVQNWGGTTPA
jgi:hypothetical protein